MNTEPKTDIDENDGIVDIELSESELRDTIKELHNQANQFRLWAEYFEKYPNFLVVDGNKFDRGVVL